MSRQREFQQRLTLYHELQDIMGAMKNMAQAEIHKLRRRQHQQQACLDAVTQAAHAITHQAQVAGHTVEPAPAVKDILLIIGSERGFCGGFNEALIRHLDGSQSPPMHGVKDMRDVILMGSRLQSIMGARGEQAEFVPGPTSEKQVATTLTATLECFQRLQQQHKKPLRLTAMCHDLHEIREVDLFPLPAIDFHTLPHPRAFHHLEPLPVLRQNIENHYLYHALLAVLYRSLYAENHRRLMQMEGALQHLDEESQQLKMQINAQRQEEIVEEIEVIFSSAQQF